MRSVLAKSKITLLFIFCFILISACSPTGEEKQELEKGDNISEGSSTETDEANAETEVISSESTDIPTSKFTISKIEGASTFVISDIDGGSSIDREIIETLSEFNAEEVDEGTKLTLPEDILFDFDSADLRNDAGEAINKLVQLAEETTEAITIIGHTDSHGSDDYNQKLSEERAQAVLEALVNANVKEDRLKAVGKGATEPVAKNTHSDGSDNPEGRQKNRRVEVIVHGFQH